MPGSDLDAFTARSVYTRPVDHKKLRFIHDALTAHAAAAGRSLAELDVLEIGCAAGAITLPLASIAGSVTGVDIDDEALDRLRARAVDAGLANVAVHHSDGSRFGAAEARYDVIVASEVFEHVTNPDGLAARLAAQLRRPGLLIVTTPNGFGPYELRNRHLNPAAYLRRANRLRRWLGKEPYVHGAGPDHAQFYTRGRLLEILRSAGFRPLRCVNSDGPLTMLGTPYHRSARLGALDARLADRLPHWAASGWYLALERR